MCLETIAEKLIDVFCCFYIGSLQCCRDCFCGSLSGCKHVRGSIGVQQWARARRKHHACAEKFRKHMIGENTIFRIVPTRIPPGTGFSSPGVRFAVWATHANSGVAERAGDARSIRCKARPFSVGAPIRTVVQNDMRTREFPGAVPLPQLTERRVLNPVKHRRILVQKVSNDLPLPLHQTVCERVIARPSRGARLRVFCTRHARKDDVRCGFLTEIPKQNVLHNACAETAINVQRMNFPASFAKGLSDAACAIEQRK
jgi:hypothetical protein